MLTERPRCLSRCCSLLADIIRGKLEAGDNIILLHDRCEPRLLVISQVASRLFADILVEQGHTKRLSCHTGGAVQRPPTGASKARFVATIADRLSRKPKKAMEAVAMLTRRAHSGII